MTFLFNFHKIYYECLINYDIFHIIIQKEVYFKFVLVLGVIFAKLAEKIVIKQASWIKDWAKFEYMYFLSGAPKTLLDMKKNPATSFF